jgi:Ca2+-binding RTX toxin-like protein
MGTVTIRGGTGQPDQSFVFTDAGALALATSIATVVNGDLSIKVKLYDNGGVFTTAGSVGAVVIDGSKAVSVTAAAGTKKQYVMAGKDGVDYTAAAGESVSIAGVGADTINAGQSTVSGNKIVAAGSHDLIDLGAGAATVTESGQFARINGGAGNAVIHDSGVNDTVTAGSGTETIFAGKSGRYNLGSGTDIVYDSTAKGASDTIDANLAGAYTVYGGTSDLISSNTGLYFVGGSGGSTTIKGSGSDVVLGGPGGSINFRATGDATFVAAAGGDTFNGAAATGYNTLFTSSTSGGGDVLIGGQGNNEFILEGDNATLTGSNAASAADNYVFVNNGPTSQTVVITNFNTVNDAIGLIGYGSEPGADAAALASATTANGVTTVSLTDGTKIELLGAPTLHSYNFF